MEDMLTFQDYVKVQNIELTEGPTKEKVMNHIKQIVAQNVNWEKQMDGLEIFYNTNSGLEWNGDEAVLNKLRRFPERANEILRKYRAGLKETHSNEAS